MPRPALLLVATVYLVTLAVARAQHDIQRDAVRRIAAGNPEQARRILESGKKPDSGAAETRFVEMLALLQEDRVAEAQEKARAALAAGLPPERFAAGPVEWLAKLPGRQELPASRLLHGP